MKKQRKLQIVSHEMKKKTPENRSGGMYLKLFKRKYMSLNAYIRKEQSSKL